MFLKIVQYLLACTLLLVHAGCASIPGKGPAPTTIQGNAAELLALSERALTSSKTNIEEIAQEARAFLGQAGWKDRGFFNAKEHDQIENLLFRYLAVHETLWNLVNSHKSLEENDRDDAVAVRRAVIAFNAGFTQTYNDTLLVDRFLDEPVAIDKLNEAFHRSDIPEGTYDRLKHNVTDVGKIRAFRKAWDEYHQTLKNPDSTLAEIKATDPFYGNLISETQTLSEGVDANLHRIIDRDITILPSVRNELHHTLVAGLGRKAVSGLGDLGHVTRSSLFKSVSRLKSPTSHLISFSDEQKRQVFDVLLPGDI